MCHQELKSAGHISHDFSQSSSDPVIVHEFSNNKVDSSWLLLQTGRRKLTPVTEVNSVVF